MKKIYLLEHDKYHSGDTGADGFAMQESLTNPFVVRDLVLLHSRYEKYQNVLPKIIYFQSNFKITLNYDFPKMDPRIFVVSKKMLGILKSMEVSDVLEIPVVLIDDMFFGEIFNKDKKINTGVPMNTDYISIVFKSSIDVMDYEKSMYSPSIMDFTQIGSISKMVLKEPLQGFPPIFKVLNDYTSVYVTEKTKEILELNGIKGCVFEPVEVTPYEG